MGDDVLIKEVNLLAAFSILGGILETFPGKDNLTTVFQFKILNDNIHHNIQNCIKLYN